MSDTETPASEAAFLSVDDGRGGGTNQPLPPPAKIDGRKKPRSPEVKAAIAAALRGRARPPEVRAKIAATLTGRKASAEARAKQSAKAKARGDMAMMWTDPKFREEQSQRSRENIKKRWQDSNGRAAILAGLAKAREVQRRQREQVQAEAAVLRQPSLQAGAGVSESDGR